MSATLLYVCFENELKVGEQRGVMYDVKSGAISLCLPHLEKVNSAERC